MRAICAHAFLLAGIALVPPANAQRPFEGQVTMQLTGESGTTIMETWIKPGKARMVMSAGGREFVMIADYEAATMLMVMPQQQMVMEMPIPAEVTSGESTAKVTRTGRSDTVAGHRCEIIRVEDKGEIVEVCGATNMGRFVMGGPGRRGQPAWGKGLEGFFPLRVADEAGKVVLQVTKIERKAVADDQFRPPAGFRTMTMPSRSRT